MIIIFVLLGLLLLGGGGATILDGLPYMVLERGFTQVIVGTVAASTGIVLLALARVLVEIRRVRSTLSNAVMALSVGAMAAEERPAGPASTALDGMAPVAAGAAVAGAGAALVAANTLNHDAAGPGAVSTETMASPDPAEPDLFAEPSAAHPDRDLVDADGVSSITSADAGAFYEADRAIAPVSLEPQPDEALSAVETPANDARDPFSEALLTAVATKIEPDSAPEPAPEVPPPAETGFQPETETSADEPPVEAVGASEARVEPKLVWPDLDEDRAATVQTSVPGDEFGFLRESLAARLAERDGAEDNLAESTTHHDPAPAEAADAWMRPPAQRREPWFGEASAQPEAGHDDAAGEEAADADLQPPPWPPSTRGPDAIETDAAPLWPGLDDQVAAVETPEDSSTPADEWREASQEAKLDEPEYAAAPDEPDTPEPQSPAAAPDEPDMPEPQSPAMAEPPPPAASDEGVVGAYQVGDAHFTIFADGSIKARTPDGEYSFASMDELKTYLASEKSRLGV